MRTFIGYENAWGTKYTSTVHTANNLGVLYREQGKMDEAEVMYRRAPEAYKKAGTRAHIDAKHNQQPG